MELIRSNVVSKLLFGAMQMFVPPQKEMTEQILYARHGAGKQKKHKLVVAAINMVSK